MSEEFFRFPHTPHLLWLGNLPPREDKVLTEAESAAFLDKPVIVEEKMDGANLGLSIDSNHTVRVQNRGQYLARGGGHHQWNLLWPWLNERQSVLLKYLRQGQIIFGEWCYARHSITYNALPDWFLGFDVYDQEAKQFWSVERRNNLFRDCGLAVVPERFRGKLKISQISSLFGQSTFGREPIEGIYLRREQGEWLESRAKVVSAEFQQQIGEHWSRKPLIPNRVVKEAIARIDS